VADLRLLQLNIEYGGTGVDFDQVVAIVTGSGAPVAALQEGCGNVPRLASALGWPYFDNRTQVVSQLPLLDPPDVLPGVVLVELEPGRVAAVVNVHPPSRRYGPFQMRNGAPDVRVVASERRIRLAAVQPSLDAARQLMRQGIPVVLLGDFNAPSHLDWTQPAVGARPHVIRPFSWPTSVAAEEAGLVDAYRAVHPDPVTHPGLTWPAGRPFVKGYNPAADGHPADRIDFMYLSPDVVVHDVQVVGEPEAPDSQVTFDPWPTDHRGLLATLTLMPAPPPALVSVARRLAPVGDQLEVRVAGVDATSVVVVPRGAEAATVVLELANTGGAKWSLPTELVGAGRFDVVARDDSRTEWARTAVWVAGPGDTASVRTDRNSYRIGEPIDVRWEWTPGNRADWVALYPAGAVPGSGRPVMQFATGATVEGGHRISQSSHPKRWPLAPGDYHVHLLMDDLPVTLASAAFTVTD
jgi:hypothetical protein